MIFRRTSATLFPISPHKQSEHLSISQFSPAKYQNLTAVLTFVKTLSYLSYSSNHLSLQVYIFSPSSLNLPALFLLSPQTPAKISTYFPNLPPKTIKNPPDFSSFPPKTDQNVTTFFLFPPKAIKISLHFPLEQLFKFHRIFPLFPQTAGETRCFPDDR